MNLKFLNRDQLDQRIKDLAKNERQILHEILLTIKEIDERRSFLDLGYSSLFSYLVEGVGYSAGSAQRRIEAARLLKHIPELGAKIQTGELKLTQVSLVQKASREAHRTSNVEVSYEDKKELLNRLSHLSFENSQKEVASFFDLPVQKETQKNIQSDGSIRIELTLSKELYEKVLKAQALVSHSNPEPDIKQFLEFVSDRIIRQKTQIRPAVRNTSTMETAAVKISEKQTSLLPTTFSARQIKSLLDKSNGCEFRDPKTHKLCGSHWFLQIDHKQSRWAGGKGVTENAQALCGAHNRLKYQQEAGLRFRS